VQDIVRYLFGFTLWFFIIGLAYWRGGWPERAVAVINLIGILVTPVVQERPFVAHFQLNILLIDFCVMVAFMVVALRSDRWWPLFATAAALMTVLTDLAYIWVHLSHRLALTGEVIWSYVAIFALAGGVAEIEWRRQRFSRLDFA
jgi:hypothetical protein